MSSPLTNPQKAAIGQLARTAYLAWAGRGHFEQVNHGLSKTACFEAWRHVEQGKACGVQLLRFCTQDHYGRLKAHFQALGGNEQGAARTRVRDADNDRRIARWKLDQELQARGLEVGYAAAICCTQYRCTLAEATAPQLWRLIYTVRSRKKPTAVAQPKGEVPF